MKRYRTCFYLMLKRMLKMPAFVFMLAAMFVIAAAASTAQQGEKAESVIGIVIDRDREADLLRTDSYKTDSRNPYEEWERDFTARLDSREGILLFQFYEDKDGLMRAVLNGETDCGFVIPYDLRDMLAADMWNDAVMVYTSSSSALTQIAKERIAAVIFTLYSEESYVNYIKNSEVFLPAKIGADNTEEIVAFAKNAYESHLLDGSTFDFIYSGDSYDARGSAENTFRLRGVLAVCIFLSGMCGLLTDWKDRKEKRFLRIAPSWAVTMANVWIPTIYTSAVSLAALLFAGQITAGGSLVKELCRLLIYQFLIVLYCSIIRLVLRKQETIAAAIPILTLACIVCCPVWIRLAVYVPVFRVLEKLFPVTYYLLIKL